MDNSCISRHNEGKPGLQGVPGQFVLDEEMFDEQVLSPIEQALPRKAERVWIVGNHDDWERQYEERVPSLAGAMQRVNRLHLVKRGWKVIDLGGIFKHGKLLWIHGEGIGGANHNKKVMDYYICSVLYGHHHTASSLTRVLSSDFKEKWTAQCNPILGNINPDYMKNKPNGWVNGISATEYHPDGCFNHYPIIVSNNRASYQGVIYEGGK